MANEQNLTMMGKARGLTTEEARKIGAKGGRRSGEARREKATMLSTLKKLLDEESPSGMTYREMATLGLIKGAVKGNALNYKTIMEALGEGKGDDNTNGVLADLVEAIKDVKKT